MGLCKSLDRDSGAKRGCLLPKTEEWVKIFQGISQEETFIERLQNYHLVLTPVCDSINKSLQ